MRHARLMSGLAATLSQGAQPTGQITFKLYGPNDSSCTRAPAFTTATTVNGNGTYNSQSFTPTASGIYRWRATYSGDANNQGAGPGSRGDRAEGVRVTIPAVVALTSSASPAVTIGGAIHDTAHLSGGSRPTGRISFRFYGPTHGGCTGRPVFAATVNVAGNDDYASPSFTRPRRALTGASPATRATRATGRPASPRATTWPRL